MPNPTARRPIYSQRRRIKSKAQSRSKRSGRQPSSSKRNPFAALAVTGIRSLVAALPGSTFLTPIVDLFFTSIGLTEKLISSSGNATSTEETAFYGLCGMTAICYANILARVSSTARNITKGPKLQFDTPYTDAKLEHVQITVLPDTKIQTRSGRWACAFVPFRNEHDAQEIIEQYKPMTLAMIQSLAGSVTSSADKPLVLRFKPRAEDGYIFQYNSISAYFGVVILGYSEELRTSYHEFTADDFAPNMTMKGTLKLRQPRMDGSVTGYEDATHIFQSKPRASVYSVKSKRWMHYAHEDFKCTETEKNCTATGRRWTAIYVPPKPLERPALTLDSMALDN